MIARFRGVELTESQICFGRSGPAIPRIFRIAADRYQTFFWNGAVRARICAVPGLPAREMSNGRVLIEPFNRGARLIG